MDCTVWIAYMVVLSTMLRATMLHLFPRVIIPVNMAVGLLQVMVMEVVMVAVCFVLGRQLQVVHHHIHM